MSTPIPSSRENLSGHRRTIPFATRRTVPSLAAAVALVLGACRGDEVSAEPIATTEAPTTETTAAGEGATATADAFCNAALRLETAPNPDVDFSEATEEQIIEAAQAWATVVLRPLADEVAAAAPADIARQVAVLSAVVDEVGATGDIAAFDSPAATAANESYLDFVVERCGWGTVNVSAVEYRFEGLPTELTAGPTRLVFSNDGGELHELLLFRRNPGADQPVEELLSLPEARLSQLVTLVGEPAFAAPGESETVVHDLEPGAYIAVCFIPTGLTSHDAVPPPEAMPHAAHGMVAELTVEP